MALLFADGFEDGLGAWIASSVTIGTGRFGSGVILSSSTGDIELGIGSLTACVLGFAFKPATVATNGICHLSASSNIHVGLRRGTNGEIIVYRGTAGSTTLGTSGAGVLPSDAWSYIELKTTISDTIGTAVVRVNGVEVLNLTNLDTKESSASATSFILGAGTNAPATVQNNVYDDFYFCDLTGGVNNDFLGEVIIEHLRPASDDTAQWLGSDSNTTDNWDLLNEVGAPVTTDYITSSTVGQRDLYVPTPSARSLSSPVLGVMVTAHAMKTDIGTRLLKFNVKEGAGGSIRQSIDFGLPTSYGEIRTTFDRKGDGSQFTVADVNALRFGVEVSG